MTASNTYGRQVVLPLVNKSGGSVAAGDVVVIDTSNNDAFTTSTAGAVTGGVGIAQETIASNATGRVLISGYAALVNVNASVTRGNYGKTHTVVKQATDAGSSRATGTFCQFLTGGTTPDALVYPVDLAGTALTNPMTTQDDIIVGGSSGTPGRLAKGSDGQVLTVDPSTHHLVWTTPTSGLVSVDAVPASPNAADQEFTSLSGWTTLGSLDSSNVTDIPGWYHIAKTATGTFQVHGIYRAIPSMPFTMTAKIHYQLVGAFQATGLMLVETGPGKLDLCGVVYPGTARTNVSRTTWASRTSRSSVPFESGPMHPAYFRLIVASSTDVTYQVSDDAILWTTIAANYNPGFTIAHYGIFVTGMDNSTSGEAMVMYIRFS